MAICIDHNSQLYKNFINKLTNNGKQSLKSLDLTDFKLDVIISHYIETYGRYPLVEELPKGLSSDQIATNINNQINERATKSVKLESKNLISIDEFNNIIGNLEGASYRLIRVYTYDNMPILDENGRPAERDYQIVHNEKVSNDEFNIQTIADLETYEGAKSNEDKTFKRKLSYRWALINTKAEESEEQSEEQKESEDSEVEEGAAKNIVQKIIENNQHPNRPKFVKGWNKGKIKYINKEDKQLQEVSIKLMSRFRGQHVLKIKEDTKIEYNIIGVPNIEEVTIEEESNLVRKGPATILNSIMKTLESKYGVKTIRVTDLDLASKKWNGELSAKERTARAFIYNGNIYINIDRANIEDPVHELLHLFASPMFTKEGLNRNVNGRTLKELLSEMEVPSSFISQFKNSSKNELDIKEEYLVTELAKFLTGQPTTLFQNSTKEANSIIKDILNELWITVSGTNNANFFGEEILSNPLEAMLKAMNSQLIKNDSMDEVFNRARLHRQHNNQINNLIKYGKVEETCE